MSSPARAAFKNLYFKSLCELGKSLFQKSLSLLKMGESTHSPAHFKLNMMNEIFYLLKSQEFINKLEKICFSLGIEFWTHRKFVVYHRTFDLRIYSLKKWAWSFKTLTSTFYAKFFNKVPTLWILGVNKTILEQVAE